MSMEPIYSTVGSGAAAPSARTRTTLRLTHVCVPPASADDPASQPARWHETCVITSKARPGLAANHRDARYCGHSRPGTPARPPRDRQSVGLALLTTTATSTQAGVETARPATLAIVREQPGP